MSYSDSTFLFEIFIEDLTTLIACDEYIIKNQFANIFTLYLKDPRTISPNESKIVSKRKAKIRDSKAIIENNSECKVHTAQSVIFTHDAASLINEMTNYPMEISFWIRSESERNKIGSTHITWNPAYIDYLNKVNTKNEPLSVTVRGEYNVFNEITSKRMASIKLNVKLSHIRDNILSYHKTLPETNIQTTKSLLNEETYAKGFKEEIGDNIYLKNIIQDTGTIRTTYSKVKQKIRNISPNNSNSRRLSPDDSEIQALNFYSSGFRSVSPDHERFRRHIPETLKCSKSDVFRAHDSSNGELTKGSTQILASNNSLEELGSKHDEVNTSGKIDLQNKYHLVDHTDLDYQKNQHLIKNSKSCSSISKRERFSALQYIYGNNIGPFGKTIYQVGYFTVQSDSPKASLKESSKTSPKGTSSTKGSSDTGSDKIERTEKYAFELCNKECPNKKDQTGSCNQSVCSLDLPAEASHLISVGKCDNVDCDYKKFQEPSPPPDERILLDLSSTRNPCCNVQETVEEIVGEIKANVEIGGNPCYCSCECKFGVTKLTRYCKICGGYEKIGEDLTKPGTHYPCPIYNRNRLKSIASNSGSGSKTMSDKRSDKKMEVESEKDSKKCKKKTKDDRFKFNYGYKGIPPQIGHSRCALPCTGNLNPVPKQMGWLWTAEDIPGMKFRPTWKPGATNKHVVRLLKIAKNPDEMLAKKKRKDVGKGKRPLKRPLLIVHKKDGEYTITMETMKTFTKARTINQHPYEDKPVLTYTIGRTDEENRERQKKKERQHRRLEREQREFIQSTFRDMCKEICMKTYQQALGILPGMEDPACPCFPAQPDATRVNMDVSCSCSAKSSVEESDTDSDEWIVEFTPPNATFDPKFKPKRVVKVDNTSQYTYLDYRVKLVDRFGNPVPRFFKGPDGKQQCSDLGGFWSSGPQKTWLEINVDGYVAPDNRWAPMSFIGPNGEQVDAETGTFQAANGKWLVVGIDGYIDGNGKWRSYPRPRNDLLPKKPKARVPQVSRKVGAHDSKKSPKKQPFKQSDTTWSCFGDISPKELSKLGVVGHGHDKQLLLATLREMLAHGDDIVIPKPSTVPKSKRKKRGSQDYKSQTHFLERTKCHHSIPSDKGIISVDEFGNKKYFKMRDLKNPRAKMRLEDLREQGISLSSFHVPCFGSFISSEAMREQLRDRLVKLASKNAAAQAN